MQPRARCRGSGYGSQRFCGPSPVRPRAGPMQPRAAGASLLKRGCTARAAEATTARLFAERRPRPTTRCARRAPTQRAAAVVRVGARTLVLASLSAPRSSSSRTHSKWPENAAVCSGVSPSCARPHTAIDSAAQRHAPQYNPPHHMARARGGDASRVLAPRRRGSSPNEGRDRRSAERSANAE